MRQLYRETGFGVWTLVTGVLLGLSVEGFEPRAADGWRQGDGFRWRPLNRASGGTVGFTRLSAAETGIGLRNHLSEESGAANRVLWNGSGVAVGDYDQDGRVDVFFCGLETPNALYRNLGNWRFEDVTSAAGLVFPAGHYRGAVFADVDGDRRLDLLVTANGLGVLCYRNLGGGRFGNVTATAGTGSRHGSSSLALADVDGNGTLDLYVSNYRADDIRDQGEVTVEQRDGKLVVPERYRNRLIVRDNHLLEYGEPDQWLLNDGKGRFTEVAWASGRFLDEDGKPLTAPPLDWGLTASFRDVDDDGRPDLYVCNDYWTPDRFWRNRGNGVFQAIERAAIRHTSASSMSVDFADIDLDGRLDLFVVDMLSRDPAYRKRQMVAQLPEPTRPGDPNHRPQVARNTLFRQRSDRTFEEIACYAGVPAADWAWSPLFLDVDLDGDDDLLVAAGHFKDVQDRDAFKLIQSRQRPREGATLAERQRRFREELKVHYRLYPPLPMPVVAFRNEGDRRFLEVTDQWGTGQPGVHHAMAMGDFDGDGDLDLVVNNLEQAAGVYRNDGAAPRLAVRLRDAPPNTGAVGAKVCLLGGATPRQSREIVAGGRYLSGAEPLAVFATGGQTNGLVLEITWPDQRVTRIEGVLPQRLYEVAPVSAEPRPPVALTPVEPWFEDQSALLHHRHAELAVNDYARQPLLPFKLSQAGPGVGWFDADGDGFDELLCGAGRGGTPLLLTRDGTGRFVATAFPGLVRAPGDTTGVLGLPLGGGVGEVLLAFSAYEARLTNAVRRFRTSAGGLKALPPLRNLLAGAGALAVGVLDEQGTTVLFTGGQVLPGGYPLGGGSLLYRRVGNAWAIDPAGSKVLANVGLVNGAMFSDLDGDGVPELILACEWGPVRIFARTPGSWRETTAEWGLDGLTGLWKGLASVDLNNDGLLDLVVANLGLNTLYHASPDRPMVLFYGDLAEMGSMALVETDYDSQGRLVPSRPLHVLAQSLPFVSGRFESIAAYSQATVPEVLGETLAQARQARVTTLASMVFLNRGHHFEPRPLPYEAQIAPALSVQAADFNGDGNEDVFLSQNFFETRVDFAPWDAGRGLLLRGDGTGRLEPLSGEESGILVYGEQRGAAVGDYDQDGRTDLVVAQNGGATRLFHNVGAKPGLRVRLRGKPGNPAGIGAQVMLIGESGPGAVREVTAGSGYWSQRSLQPVLSLHEKVLEVVARWPGGRVSRASVDEGASFVQIGP